MKRINHGACGKWWDDARWGHCGACHETFTGKAFDKHQSITRGVLSCTLADLEAVPKQWGTLWRIPMTEARIGQLSRMNDGRA